MISVESYINQTRKLIEAGTYTDGCSTPFKTFIHRWLKKSHLLCAAHDFGSLGFIKGVRGGWHNNLHTLIAHWVQPNPIYWIWGTVVALTTLPWVIWRRNLNITFIPFIPFHIALALITTVVTLIIKFP